jgi:hypothetical protein
MRWSEPSNASTPGTRIVLPPAPSIARGDGSVDVKGSIAVTYGGRLLHGRAGMNPSLLARSEARRRSDGSAGLAARPQDDAGADYEATKPSPNSPLSDANVICRL